MLAPIDKLNRRGNDIIQVVITTACDRNCSNCTELLPYRVDYRFMSTACFEKAVTSLKDWPGVVALFGGNPCVHPRFQDFCSILSTLITPERRGLWTNNLFKHGSIAAQTFAKGRLNLNAHGDPQAFREMDHWFPGKVIPGSDRQASWHAAILANRTDMGMTLNEWVQRRERCDINQKWSGSIVERSGEPFGYFCEVAGALDGIRGVNNGIPAVPGWWKSTMDTFEPQVRNCCDQGCGVPLRIQGHQDIEETYDVSPSWKDLTYSPRVPTQVNYITADAQDVRSCAAADDYMRRFPS